MLQSCNCRMLKNASAAASMCRLRNVPQCTQGCSQVCFNGKRHSFSQPSATSLKEMRLIAKGYMHLSEGILPDFILIWPSPARQTETDARPGNVRVLGGAETHKTCDTPCVVSVRSCRGKSSVHFRLSLASLKSH